MIRYTSYAFIERTVLHYKALDHPSFVRTVRKISSLLEQVNPKPILIGLTGDLGAGKTELVKNFLPSILDISSPTYNIINTYNGICLHIDLYRLSGDISNIEMDIVEQMEFVDYVFIEWVSRSTYLYSKLDVELVICVDKNDRRSIEVKSNKSSIAQLFISSL